MRNKVTKQRAFLYCVIIFSLLGTPIAFSQSQVSDTSDLEKNLEQKAKELTEAAKNVAIKKLEKIEDFLSKTIEDLRNIYKDQLEEISEMETEAKKMIEKNKNDQLAKDWLEALDVLREKWNIFISSLGKHEDLIKKLKESKEKF